MAEWIRRGVVDGGIRGERGRLFTPFYELRLKVLDVGGADAAPGIESPDRGGVEQFLARGLRDCPFITSPEY